MTTITVRSDGINWVRYHTLELDEVTMTARETESWRAHKYEDRGRHIRGCPRADFQTNSVDIQAWKDAGEPGGFDGLRENFRRPPTVRIEGKVYNLEASHG